MLCAKHKQLWETHNPWSWERAGLDQCSSQHSLHHHCVRPGWQTLAHMTQSPGTSKYKTQMQVAHALKHLQVQSLDFPLGLR